MANGKMMTLIESKRSFALTAPLEPHRAFGAVVQELLEAYTAEPLRVGLHTKPRPSEVLEWAVVEVNSVIPSEDDFRFVHKALLKQFGYWEKGKPKAVGLRVPLPVRFSTKLEIQRDEKLLHTFKDTDGTIVFVYETAVRQAEYFVVYY